MSAIMLSQPARFSSGSHVLCLMMVSQSIHLTWLLVLAYCVMPPFAMRCAVILSGS